MKRTDNSSHADSNDLKTRFAENLNAVLDEKNAPARGHGRTRFLAQAINVGVSTAGKWLLGSTVPDLDRIEAICERFSCTYDDLLMAPKRSGEVSSHNIPAFQAVLSDFGFLKEPGESIRLLETTGDLVSDAELYLYKVLSNIMEPFAVTGDWVAVRPAIRISGAAVYLLAQNEELTLRRVQPQSNGDLRLLSENRRYGDETVNAEDVPKLHVVGLVVARILIGR